MPRGFAQRRTIFMPGMGAPNTSNKLGFTTYAMWALCLVVVGVCYKLEQDELKKQPAALKGLPDDVKKVLKSGDWLMRALSGPPRPWGFLTRPGLVRARR